MNKPLKQNIWSYDKANGAGALGEITFLRTYSKVKQGGGKETWEETVERYFTFLQRKFPQIDGKSFIQAWEKVLNKEIVPSMRLLQYAGPLIDRQACTAYNCSFLNINKVICFTEVLYLNMCGVGIGFNIQKSQVSKLPQIRKLTPGVCPFVFPVKDSTFGWCTAYKIFLRLRWSGWSINLDLSAIRAKGASLSRGGFASGPDNFNLIIEKSLNILKNAEGRGISSLETLDLLTFSTYYVSSGAARRVATISLSDLNDTEMREAKMGEFYKENIHRTVSNNSVKYSEKPLREEFEKEWDSLRKSGSGERGIFNISNFEKIASSRRNKASKEVWGTNPCGEIILRDCQFCNLSEVIVKYWDTEETLIEKIRLASLIGTWQSLFTDFSDKFLRKIWKENTEEERLLGVSLTGIMDSKLLRGNGKLLSLLKKVAVDTNREEAAKLGINQSASVTCVKPSGTVSTVMNTAAGLHPRFANYYIRRVRFPSMDKLPVILKEAGYKVTQDPYSETNLCVEFPVESPKDAIISEGFSALDQLEHWKCLKLNFCEHNPSITCTLKDHEWDSVKDWVWNNWEFIGGITFLPLLDNVYTAAPYEKISKEEFMKMKANLKKINLDIIYNLNKEDTRHETSGCDSCS